MSIRPLGNRVIVKQKEVETTTSFGFVLPESVGEKPEQGEVIAVGPGNVVNGKLIPVELKVGDQVLFGKYAGQSIKSDGVDVLVMKEDDIIGVLES